jgi:hypothetical protein
MHPSEALIRLRGRRLAMFWIFKNGVRQSCAAPSSVNKAPSRMHAPGPRKRCCSGHSLPSKASLDSVRGKMNCATRRRGLATLIGACND